ncbi:hypothetical protein [Fluviibacterium sp. S390]|uniref:hypothetical protein n=1 Tax=Fluviibacterium sp. S390 TaxID=3415139 RepID=UPI003C7A5BF2
MPALRTAPARLALAAFLASTALSAQAEITPDALWQRWQDSIASEGRSVTAERSQPDGRTLRLDGVTVTQPLHEGGALTARLDTIALQDGGNGTVTVVIAPGQELHIATQGTDSPSDALSARFDLGGDGLTLSVAGDIAAPDYAFASDSFQMRLTELVQDTTPLEAAGDLTLDRLAGTVAGTDPAAGAPLSTRFTAGRAAMTLDLTDPATGVTSSSATAQQDLDGAASFEPGTRSGTWSVAGSFTAGQAETRSLQTSPEIGRVETTSRQDSTAARLAVDATRASYDVTAKGLAFTFASDQFPVPPINVTLPEMVAALTIPMAAAPEAQIARLALKLSQLSLDDALWNMLDPGRALPRTPADLDLDIEADLIVRDTVQTPAPPAPGLSAQAQPDMPLPDLLPTGLRINALTLGFAGAEVAATGDFTVNMMGDPPAPNLTQPVGQLNVTATGITTLLQQLSAAGLLASDQAMGVQLMLGMFTTPGADDSLTSTITAEPGGGLVINGNRVR